MLAMVIYDEYREWFSSYDEEGVCSTPKWEALSESDKTAWRRVAAAAEQEVKTVITSSW